MPKFSANLTMMFTEVDFVERFAKAAANDFTAVEYMFPYEWQAEQFEKRSNIRCKLDLKGVDPDLPKKLRTTLFRILQEALTNVTRHANADLVEVALKQDKHWLILLITDNGRGISPIDLASNRSFGLLGMRERAAIFGGKVEIETVPDQKGTQVKVWVPSHAIQEVKDREQTADDR